MSNSMQRMLLPLLAAALILLAGTGHARLVEEQLQVPVKVADAYGKMIAQDIVVTLFHDDTTPQPRPLLMLNHGRAADAAGRAALGRARYTDASRWLAGLGFTVAVPTRIGYGVSDGEDLEYTGACKQKNYPPGYAAAADQTLQVIDALRTSGTSGNRGNISFKQTVVMGQSFGGATAIALAARNQPEIHLAINFAGGGGGNPKTQPQNPCAPKSLEHLFAGYGKTTRIPTLWIYAENDMYFGARLPREWFAAFKKAGGHGEFHQFPPEGDDGHALFTRAPQLWRPKVLEFLRANGFPALSAATVR